MSGYFERPFYFVRHGETNWNRAKRIMGGCDIPLNDRGRNQAISLARCFPEDVGTIYTSPLRRAYETAAILAQSLRKPLYRVAALRERCWGIGEGAPQNDHHFLGSADTPVGLPIGAESWFSLSERVLCGVRLVLSHHTASDPPLLVAHGGVFRVLARYVGQPDLRATNTACFLWEPATHGAFRLLDFH